MNTCAKVVENKIKMVDEVCILVKRCHSDLSCCGIVLDENNGIVLTVASLFADLLPEIERQCAFSVECPLLSSDEFASIRPRSRIAVEVVLRKNKQDAFTTLQGNVVLFWRDDGLQSIAERIFPSSEWKFESLSNNQGCELNTVDAMAETVATKPPLIEASTHQSVLSCFVLIHVDGIKNYLSNKKLDLSTLRYSNYESPKKGDEVLIAGTPFGCECPAVFYNSVSKGIVSNIIGVNNELVITDARCIPGCEGCAMYLKSFNFGLEKLRMIPHGIVLAPFCWKNGEWIGITVACSILYLLQNLMELVRKKSLVLPQNLQALLNVVNLEDNLQCQPAAGDDSSGKDVDLMLIHHRPCGLNADCIFQTALASVVLVQCGRTWGSGIILDVDEGFVATCSHVIQGHLPITDHKSIVHSVNGTRQDRISCLLPNGICRTAEVLYASSKESPLDIALLKIQPHSSLRSLKPRQGKSGPNKKSQNSSCPLYFKGEEVLVVGFPLFSSHQHAQPSLICGVLSNIAYDKHQAVLLQSSAAVHRGASGGALVSMATGDLLGMVTSHTKNADLTSAFPHVNFSIPVDLLNKLVSLIKSGLIEDGMQALVSDHVESIWKLKSSSRGSPQISSKL